MLFRRRNAAARLDQELQFHLEQLISENLAAGMEQAEARSAALRLFGNSALLREEAQSSWSWNSLAKVWRDLRYGARTLRRSPGFAALAVTVMALGIGATTSLFTVVRSVLLNPLPFAEPEKLVMVYEHFRDAENQGWTPYNQVAVGDYLGNGTDDILFRNNATGDVGFYQMSNGVNVGWHDIGGSSTAYSRRR